MKWKFVSGGCSLVRNMGEHPCTAVYENEVGTRIALHTTAEHHFKMPMEVDDPAKLLPPAFGL